MYMKKIKFLKLHLKYNILFIFNSIIRSICIYLDSCCLAAVVVVFDNCCCHCCPHHWRPHRSPSTSTYRPPTPGRWTWPPSWRSPTPWCRWTLSRCKHKGDNLGSQVRVRLPTVTHQRRQNLIYLVKSPKSRLRPWKRRKHEDTRNIQFCRKRFFWFSRLYFSIK